MRLILTLDHKPNQVLPINYQWLIASWIYRTLEKADAEFSNWLHENGFGYQGKQYKLFTFGSLNPKWYQIDKRAKAIVLEKAPTTLCLSFYADEAIQHFIMGLFKDQHFSLQSSRFQADFTVSGIEMLPKPQFQESMQFRLLTPICISQQVEGQKYADYLHPEDEGYAELLMQNLLHKQSALRQQATPGPSHTEIDFPYDFQLRSTPRSKLLTIKGIQVRGFLYDFELAAPAALLELGYYAGFGEKNSGLGMGMVGVRTEKGQP
ncbi:MAG: CRISPR-associated endoribonuclease [Saprospiraceae bacterium]|nr:MAG: CRISPR-associated endoribonuclease [Saprospiraceae bacterium]